MSCECVPVEIFVDKVLCRLLPDGPEPLRAERSHPDEIAGLRGVPLVPEPVNTTSLEHQETMLHCSEFYLLNIGRKNRTPISEALLRSMSASDRPHLFEAEAALYN